MGSRQGKHKETKTLFGAYVEPEVKALAILVSDRLGISFTDIILNGLKSEANRAGVMKGDDIVPELKDAHASIVEMVKESIKEKKARK